MISENKLVNQESLYTIMHQNKLRSSLKGQPCAVKITLGTRRTKAKKLPSPPNTLELECTISGLSFLIVLKICQYEMFGINLMFATRNFSAKTPLSLATTTASYPFGIWVAR